MRLLRMISIASLGYAAWKGYKSYRGNHPTPPRVRTF